MSELIDPKRLRQRLEEHAETLRRRFRGAETPPPQPIDDALREWNETYQGIADRLRPLVADTVGLLHDALARGERILAEGAQGTFLDVDLGTYPYVTSSTTTAGGACSGLGLPPTSIRKVVGICKTYATRVGEGPFPTELHDGDAEALRDRGGEFGATTGRPRRVGWCDLAQLRHAVRINGVNSLVLTKLDVLTGEPRIRFGVGYRQSSDPSRTYRYPFADVDAYRSCSPVYDEMPGWTEDVLERPAVAGAAPNGARLHRANRDRGRRDRAFGLGGLRAQRGGHRPPHPSRGTDPAGAPNRPSACRCRGPGSHQPGLPGLRRRATLLASR